MSESFWRKCSVCKTPIGFDTKYWACNVSTCNQKRTGLYFCSVDCWDAHLPFARHRDAWAEDRRSPTSGSEHERTPKLVDMRPSSKPAKTASPTGGSASLQLDPAPPDEILVVASKIKTFIAARSGMKTSAGLMKVLSERVRTLCDQAIRSAHHNGRKTVLDRDL